MRQYDTLINFIISNILGKYMKKYVDANSYPVITGGSSVSNCIKPHKIKISDIDIVFVCMNIAEKTKKDAENKRAQFLNDIIEDQELKTFCHEKLYIDNIYQEKPEYKRIVTIKLVRLCVNNHSLIDTSVQDVTINKILGKYPMMRKSDQLIPYYVRNGILWATCKYMVYDTVRIILHYHVTLNLNVNNILSAKRFIVYIQKLCFLLNIRDNVMKKYVTEFKNKKDINIEEINLLYNLLHKNKQFLSYKNKLLSTIPDAWKEVIVVD